MKAESIKGKSVEEIKVALQESKLDNFEPTLAIVFLSVKQNIDEISNILNGEGIAIFGATTNGEFIDEELEKESITMILLDINPEFFMVLFDEFHSHNYREVTQDMAKRASAKFNTPAFLISGSHLETDVEEMISGFEDVMGKNVNIFGGMAGDDYLFAEQFVFTNSKSSNRGIVALILDESKINIKGRATHGWKAVGTEKTVTKSDGKHVFTVNNTPVLELTKKYGGLDDLIAENDDQLAMIATNFPLQLQRETGDPVMRPGLMIDWSDGSFYCGGRVPEGSKVKFSLPPDFDVIEKVIQGVEELKETEMPEADAVIIFSCAGRLISLGPMMSKEIEGVMDIWKAPMAGFFSNGEIARATDGNNDLHNLTTCCIAIKEK